MLRLKYMGELHGGIALVDDGSSLYANHALATLLGAFQCQFWNETLANVRKSR